MIRIGVIGTAGRKDDAALLDKNVYDRMYHSLTHVLGNWANTPITLVSGGAAWADHLAVRAFLDKRVAALELHFPTEFKNSKFLETQDKMSPGRIANWYHSQMQRKANINSLRQIQLAIDAGAKTTTSAGFFQRNKLVGNVDILLAFTFGTDNYEGDPVSAQEAGLKDGGTAHTWDNSKAPYRIHYNLFEYLV